MSQFNQFGLDENILKLLSEIGYETPTPVQEGAIPLILEGHDVIASAQTGTGKTAAFMLPVVHMLSQPEFREGSGPQILVLVPTRELACQVAAESEKFSKYLSKIKTVCIYGGVPYPPQRKALASRYEILVATPGRLIDHLEQGRVNLSNIKFFVLDEADRMLDMGFVDAVQEIVKAMPQKRQTLLFSATIDKKILPLSKKLQNNPRELKIESTQTLQNNIEQRLYYVDGVKHKVQILEHLFEFGGIYQTIVFTSTIRQADELAMNMRKKGYASEALHGDMNQRQRTRTINHLRKGRIQFLIATDVAARGIDISTISHVINFDLPFQAEDFIHRIGRTGRAGATGIAITFATYREDALLSKICKLMGKTIEPHTIEGMEPKAKVVEKHEPRDQRRSRRPSFHKKRPQGGNFKPRRAPVPA